MNKRVKVIEWEALVKELKGDNQLISPMFQGRIPTF
jgi:hypothetical protein